MTLEEVPVREAVPARPGSDVFVSYSRRDRAVVERLTAALEERGRSSWVDFADIPPTAEWMAEIRGAIDASDTVVVVLSPDSVASSVCTEELGAAVAANKRIVPVVVRDVAPAEVPPELAKRNWLFLRESDDFAAGVDTLITTLETDLDATRFHTGLLVKAREWSEAGEPRSRLLRGGDLSEAEAYVASPGKGPAPTQEQTSFVLASRKAASRRQRGFVVGVSIALVTSLVLGGLALAQRQTALANEREAVEQRERAQEQTRVARSGELAQAAISQLAEDPELSLLLAIEAARIRRTVLVERSLREAVAASQVSLVYREHEADVNDLVFGPDGSWIASSSDDGTIRVWDPGTGATRFTIATGEHDTPLGRTFAVAADPSGRWLASAGERGGVRLWDPESGELLRTLEVRPYVYAMSTSSDGTVLATAGDAGVVAWDPNTAERIADIDVPGGAYGVGVSPDGRTLATAGGDRTIRLWSVASGAQIGRPFRGHQGLAWLAAFSPDGTKLVTAAEDRTARVWDVATREMEHVLPHVSLIQDAQFTRDGDYVVTADSEGVARIWSLATDEPVTELRGHETWITYLAVDPSHDRVATASVDGTVRVWRLGPGVATRTFDRGTMTWGASFGPEGATVAAAGTSDVVHVFDVGSGALLRTLTVPGSGRRELGAPVYSADGGTLAAPGIELPDATGFVQLWDASGSPTQRLDLDEFPLGISFSPDGERLVTNGIDASVRVWGLGSGEVTASYEGRRCPLQLPALAQVCTATFSPDGRTVLLTDGPAAVIWDPSTDEVIRRFRDDEGRGTQGHDLYSASFSPDGTMIATASEDSSVVVWDVAGGTQIARLEGHQGPVMSATFSPDGRSVVSASQDGTARVWSLDGEELARYRAAELMVNSAVFAADGRTILVSTAEGITNAPPGVPLKKVTTGGAKLFACEICVSYDDLLALARSRVTRQLTADERQRFLSTST